MELVTGSRYPNLSRVPLKRGYFLYKDLSVGRIVLLPIRGVCVCGGGVLAKLCFLHLEFYEDITKLV